MKGIIIAVGLDFCCSGVFYILTLNFSSNVFFCFAIYLSNVFVVLIQAILFPNLVKVFGVKYITEIYGPLVIVMTAVSFLLSVIFYVFAGVFEKGDDFPYFILTGIASFLAMSSLFISITLDIKQFDYSNGSNNDDTIKTLELNSADAQLLPTNEESKE